MTPLLSAIKESEPLSTTTLRRLHRQLLQERSAQLERAIVLVDHSEADNAITVECELMPALVARARRTVDEINEALLRMDDGTYGNCDPCGARLPIARLEAIPHARSCVACQTSPHSSG